MDKPTKPTNLIPRSFGGVKNNFSANLQNSGYEDGVPAIYGGDNLNYQLDSTGKELDYCEKICDYINAIPINKTPIVDANNKLTYVQYDIKVYNANDTYAENELVTGIVNGVKDIYRSVQNNNTNHSLSDTNWWVKTTIIGNGGNRNIGEIVTSTLPLNDAGLHLLDGALVQGSGVYGAFVNYISGLVTDYPNLFITESAWQDAVTTYGVCGKFVYNSTNNTVRLPKITGILEGTTDVNALGELIQAGLPNITGSVTETYQFGQGDGTNPMPTTTGCLRFQKSNLSGSSQAYGHGYIFDIDASRSNSIYGNSSTVQPQAIKVLYYIVVATTTKTDIEVDIDEIATDLNNKANTDLVNVTDTGKILMANASMPSDTYETLTLSTSGTTYTAPADGWFTLSMRQTQTYNANGIIVLANITKGYGSYIPAPGGSNYTVFLPASKNDTVEADFVGHAPTISLRFIYANGSESEAS